MSEYWQYYKKNSSFMGDVGLKAQTPEASLKFLSSFHF